MIGKRFGRGAAVVVGALALAGVASAQPAPEGGAATPYQASGGNGQWNSSVGLPDIAFPPRPPQIQQVTPFPGLGQAYDYSRYQTPLTAPKLPAGFTPLFNGKDLSGWHVSKTSRHGHTPEFRAFGGMIVGTQHTLGVGGLLLTDKKYRNFEMVFEAKADWGADSAVFFRTTEDGAAYQVTMDYLPGGSMGRVIAEGGIVGVGRPLGQENAPQGGAGAGGAAAAGGAARTPDKGMSVWKPLDWNSVRIRVEGDTPHVMVWINGELVTDFTDQANRAIGQMTSGPLALQVHGGPHRWQPGAFWRWRNLGIRELP